MPFYFLGKATLNFAFSNCISTSRRISLLKPHGPCKVAAELTPTHSPLASLLEEHRMSSESIPAIEYPDRIGFVPDNPYLKEFKPFIPPEVVLPELTILPLIVGTLLGIVFGASSLYLVLKVGLTVSASIPVAVISITVFKMLAKLGVREATILEHNIVQTAGSAGESIAFGLGVTMPAIMILGFDLELGRVMLVAVLGGLLGILMMIPLTRPDRGPTWILEVSGRNGLRGSVESGRLRGIAKGIKGRR